MLYSRIYERIVKPNIHIYIYKYIHTRNETVFAGK